MALDIDIKVLIEKQIKAILGDPILSAIPTDLQGIEPAILLAQQDYWKSYPHTYREFSTYRFNENSPKEVSIDSILDASLNGVTLPSGASAYYIGIYRLEYFNKNELFNNQGMDSYLLGVPFRQRLLPSNYEKYLLNKTQMNFLQGTVETIVDRVRNVITYTFPYALIDYTVYHGIGFSDPTLSFIDRNKIHIFSKMVMDKYLDMLLAVRSTLELQGDYTLKVDFIEKLKDKNTEDLKMLLNSTCFTPMILQ